jgi:hypothetical protein
MKKIVFLIMIIPVIVMSGSITEISSFASPDVYPNGLAWDGTNLWLLGGSSDGFYKLDPSDGTVLDSFIPSEPTENAHGCTFDGTNLWGNWGDTEVYEYTTSGTLVSQFSSVNDTFGLAFDGTNLWISSHNNNIYEYQTDGTQLGSFSSPISNPDDLAFDGTHIWIPAGTDIYRVETDGTVVDSFDLSSISGSFSATGMTYDGIYFWVSDQTTDIIYQLELQSTAITSTSIGKIKTLFE